MNESQQGEDCAVILVAAGRGERAGGGTPKQFRSIAGMCPLARSIVRYSAALPGASILTIINPDDTELFRQAAEQAGNPGTLLAPALGGATRQQSVAAGLRELQKSDLKRKYVLIHDSVRCFASDTLLEEAVAQVHRHNAVVPVIAVSDSLRRKSSDSSSEAVPREGLFAVQTPQAFRLDLIADAHAQAQAAGRHDFSDDASLAEWAGHAISLFPGEPGNVKLTTQEDFAMAEARLLAALADVRTGFGYDVHAFCAGDHVWLGGVRISHDHGLEGHSDADVALHALTDAILGAIADGDIGMHFPPSDPRWRGAASEMFLKAAAGKVRARNGMIAHLDVTIVCEAPRVGPHRDAIRNSIASIAGLEPGRVAVKATTSEKLGFTGRREGIAASAVATVRLPLTTA